MIPNREFKLSELSLMNSSASEIDNINATMYNIKDYPASDYTKSINLAITDCVAKGGHTVYVPNGTYELRITTDAEVPLMDNTQKNPAIYLPSNITLIGESKIGTILKLSTSMVNESVSNIASYGEENINLMNLTVYGNKIDNTHRVGEREGYDIKDCKNINIINVRFENIEHEAIDIDVYDRPAWNAIDLIQYRVYNCDFINIGGNGVHNGDWIHVKDCNFKNVANNRYSGMKLGNAGTEGQGAIDTFGHYAIYENCVFDECVRAVHNYGTFPFSGHTHIIKNCRVKNGLFQDDKLIEIDMNNTYGIIDNCKLVSKYPRVDCLYLLNSEIVSYPITTTNNTFVEFARCDNTTFIGVATMTFGNNRVEGCYIKNSRVIKTGNTVAVAAVSIQGVNANGVTIDNNLIIQDGSYAACGTHEDIVQSGHIITRNTIKNGTHSIRVASGSIVSGNVCTLSSVWGVSAYKDNNIITGNITNKDIRGLGIGNVIASNILVA